MSPQHAHQKRRFPIKWVAVIGMGLLLTVSVTSVLFMGISTARKNTDELLSVNIELVLDAISARIDAHLKPVEQQAVQISRAFKNGTISLEDRHQLKAYLSGHLSSSPQVSAFGIVRLGYPMTAISSLDFEMSELPWPRRAGFKTLIQEIAKDRKPRWRPPVWSVKLKQAISTHYTALEVDGQFMGVLVQTVPVAELSRFLNRQDMMDGVPFIYYDDDKLIAHPKLISWKPVNADNRKVTDGVPIATINDIGEAILEEIVASPGYPLGIVSNLKKSSGKAVHYGEREYILFTRTIKTYGTTPWTIGFYFDAARADQGIFERLILTLVVGLVFLVLSVSFAMYAGSRFSRPIRLLAQSMMLVKNGSIAEVRDLPRSRISEVDDAAQSFNGMVSGLLERDLIRQTLGRYVPAKVAETLLKEDGALETEEALATVLFADIEGFTKLTESLGPEGIVSLLNAYFSDMVEIIERFGGVVTQFQGDAILATFNIPIQDINHASNALNAAIEMRAHNLTETYNDHRVLARIGINTGHLVAGAVGAKGRLNYTVHGDAVNLAARIENLNKEYGTYILTTQSTIDQTTGIEGKFVGETTVRGQSTPVKLYTLPDQNA